MQRCQLRPDQPGRRQDDSRKHRQNGLTRTHGPRRP
jgi:hypothetical protein